MVSYGDYQTYYGKRITHFESVPNWKCRTLMSEAISMVQHDAPEVFEAIEKANPYAESVRRQFFDLAASLSVELETASRTLQLNENGN